MSQEITDPVIDIAEFALDRIVDNEIIRELPVIGTAVGLARAAKGIADHIFAAKIDRFLFHLGDVDPGKRNAFYNELHSDKKLRDRTGTAVLMALQRADDIRKAAIIGRLFSGLINKEIPFDVFHRLLFAVDRAFIEDLLVFPKWAHGNAPGFDPKGLDGTGLVDRVNPQPRGVIQSPLPYGTSELGQTYVRLMLGVETGD